MSCNNNHTVLAILCEAFNTESQTEYEGIRVAFALLYQAMHRMLLHDVDRVIYPVCVLCQEHEKQGFLRSVGVGFQLARELNGLGTQFHSPLGTCISL